MANPAADPKSAPLAEELKDFALNLDRSALPKNFFCALCDQLAFDSYKLLCCNKAICASCQAKLQFPTTCPLCEHSPLEADSCAPNKSLRNTMRVWLQKQKKKEENKAASQVVTPVVDTVPAPSDSQPTEAVSEKPVETVEVESKPNHAAAEPVIVESVSEEPQRPASAASQTKEDADSVQNDEAQNDNQNVENTDGQGEDQKMNGQNGPMFGNNPMMNMNGMPNQFGFGFNPTQANMSGMGMGSMPNMPNMMGGAWNMNPMDYGMNSMNMNGMANGMFGGFGGNMGMGMNDMSAMNFGGGFGNGWNGMGSAGYGFNGYNQMGGYNQSGAYPEMMNQFPKNNYPNQNRFHANGGNFLQQQNNRNGSNGGGYGSGAGLQHSRPGSRSGSAQNRDGESPGQAADSAADIKDEGAGSVDPALEGKDETNITKNEHTENNEHIDGATSTNASKVAGNLTAVGAEGVDSPALNQIQTVDSVEMESQDFDHSMMGNGMQSDMQYHPHMMNQFQQTQMNGPYNSNMGYHQNNFGHRGGFNHAYGAATVLTGEPRGIGVEGAPTGPRAMREGRPNTGFSSRAINARYNAPPPSVTPAAEVTQSSPPRRVRSRSPVRDDTLRTKDKSPSRSRTGSRAKEDPSDSHRERSRSVERHEKREDRDRSLTPRAEDEPDHERRKDKRRHRSSRYEDHDDKDERDDHDERYRDDRDSRESRGDKTRSASVDSRYRSRREKDKYRSSRSHRDRSRDYRRRHRSRSHSPAVEEEDVESSSRRKGRNDKDRHRERDRDRSRDRDRERDRKERKERDYDREYDDEKHRSRDKDRERRRRREREAPDDDRDYDDDKHRSSRRSRKDRDRERDREYEKESSARTVSPPLNAPTGPSADNFSIRGASKPKVPTAMAPPQPPTGPRAFQPPKGPAADRDRDRKHSKKGSISSSIPSTPTEPTQDHYAAEREKNARARDLLERGDRSLHSRTSSSHYSSQLSLSSKRSRDEIDGLREDSSSKDVLGAPTGPSTHRDKRRKSSDAGGMDLASALTKGLRKKAGAPRRGGVKTEGDVERELERVERERDGRRW